MRRLRWIGVLLAGALGLSSCSIAGALNGEEILDELDGIIRVEGVGPDRRVVYAEEAVLLRDYMRLVALAPVRRALAVVFGDRDVRQLQNPGEHVRGLLTALPDRTAGGWFSAPDLGACSRACARFAWLAELAPNPTTRIRSLDGLSRICRQLNLKPFDGDVSARLTPLDPDNAREALALLRTHFSDETAVTPQLAEALEVVSSAPLDTYEDRALLVEELGAWHASSADSQLRAPLAAALRSAIGHAARGALLRSVIGRSRTLAEVRLCGMEQVRRLGGPRSVPLLLAAMSASPAERAQGAPAFDTDTLVMLRLIHYCGQLGPEAARAVVRLPGRRDWEATSASEFLARTILAETDYYSQLRTPAIVALTWCLGRPTIDLDPAWVREWIEDRDA